MKHNALTSQSPLQIPFATKSVLLCALLALDVLSARAGDPNPVQKLLDGNQRYLEGKPSHPHQDARRRTEVAEGQKPFAIIVGCADSRTAPEILFDQGLGDLFVIRLAGNVVDEAALGSIEFATAKLGARLIIVLGHEKCGAVMAAVDGVAKGTEAPAHLKSFVDAIKPAAESVRGQPGDPVENAVRANVHLIVEKLKLAEPIVAPMVKSGELQIVGARYDLDDGKVELLP